MPEIFKKMPSIYNIEVFSKCNLACPMCPTGISKSQINYYKSAICITLITKLIEQKAFGNTSFMELHFRGEPTLHKQLALIITTLKPHVDYLGLSTHAGTLHSLTVRKALLKLEYITFSIDGVEDDYEKIRIGNNFIKVVDGLDIFFKEKGTSKFPLVDIQTVEVPGTDFELQKQLVQELIENRGWNAQFRSMEDTLTWQRNLTPLANKEICENPWNSVSIKANGDVVACCLAFEDSPELTYGNLYENTLIDIWHGEKAQQFRAEHLTRKTNKFCSACSFRSPYKFHDDLIITALEKA